MKQFLLIDSHALIHRFFHALPPLTTPTGDPVGVVYGMANIMLKLHREQKPDYIAAVFDRPEKTFREEIFTDYKANRPPAPDDLISQFKRVRELFDRFSVRTVEFPGYEADDLIGSLVERFKDEPDITLTILTGDLDLLQLVDGERVVVKFLQKGMSDTKMYNEAAVLERYGVAPKILPDLKGLLGDQSDNIPGVAGVGPKTATPLIQKYGTLENLIDHLWEVPDKVGMKIDAARETALFSKKLATIARNAPLAVEGISDFILKPLDSAHVRPYFESLGFKSLAERLP